MLSNSGARFMELEARITRQQNKFDRKEKILSERLSQIERQLNRFDEVKSKLDNLNDNIESKLNRSQQAQTTFTLVACDFAKVGKQHVQGWWIKHVTVNSIREVVPGNGIKSHSGKFFHQGI
jgi:DNA repair exonuclease SbcCD ATPase subunit